MVWENKKAVVPRLDYFENKGVMSGSKEFPHIDHMKDEFRYKIEPVENQLKGYPFQSPHSSFIIKGYGTIYKRHF